MANNKTELFQRIWHSPYTLAGMYTLAFIVVELLLRAFTDPSSFFTSSLWLLLAFTAFLAVLGYGLIVLVPQRRLRQVLLLVWLGIQSVLAMSQLIYYRMMGTYYILNSLSHADQVAEFGDSILGQIGADFFCLLAMAIPFAGIAFVVLRFPSVTEQQTLLPKWVLLSAALALYAVGQGMVLCNPSLNPSPKSLYWEAPDSTASLRTFGTLTALRVEIRFHLFGSSLRSLDSEAPVDLPSLPVAEPEQPGAPTVPENPPKEPTYHTLDIDFDALLDASANDNVRFLHEYFRSVSPTQTNDYTGLFQGKNLITITAESLDLSAVRADVTPTLYKLAHDGLEFTNYYAPGWAVSTLDGEYVNTLGLMPKGGVWSLYRARNNNLYFSLGNSAQREGYQTWAFHNYFHDFYDRNLSHPNLGYRFLALDAGLSIPSEGMWPPSDVDLMEVSPPYYLSSDEPFCVYYLTVSGHAPYSYLGNMMAYRNREATAKLPLSEESRAYLSCQIELDRAMERLLQQLEQAGVLQDTLIVLSTDHYPYALSEEALAELRGEAPDSNFERYRNTLIIYNPSLEHTVIDKPCYSIDILPTVLNLMGFSYDSRLLAGRDILSSSEGLVVFQNRSWITEYGRYHAQTGVFTPNEGVNVDEGYVQQVNQVVAKKFTASIGVLDNDYYAVLFGENPSKHP